MQNQRLPSSRCLQSSRTFEVHFHICCFKISLDIILIIQKYGEIPVVNWLCTIRNVLYEACLSRTTRAVKFHEFRLNLRTRAEIFKPSFTTWSSQNAVKPDKKAIQATKYGSYYITGDERG